jgi:hypothetical protein
MPDARIHELVRTAEDATGQPKSEQLRGEFTIAICRKDA